MPYRDNSAELQQKVQAAYQQKTPLWIQGGDSKRFWWGMPPPAQTLENTLQLTTHRGIVDYQPAELVITARAGTLLKIVMAELAHAGQTLAFEPPAWGENATLGGVIACNLSGPRRVAAGSARDFVLGMRILNGRGEFITVGGTVMKNVAGFDVARLLAGSFGTLGVILEVSLKVLPTPPASLTLKQTCASAQAIERMNHYLTRPYPITALSYEADAEHLWIRLEGAACAVEAARAALGGELLSESAAALYWHTLREHQQPFFQPQTTLWRLSLQSTAPFLSGPGHWYCEWGGALRWYHGPLPAATLRAYAERYGGHALQLRNPQMDVPVFQPLTPGLAHLHRRLKQAFDPHCIFNRGRLIHADPVT